MCLLWVVWELCQVSEVLRFGPNQHLNDWHAEECNRYNIQIKHQTTSGSTYIQDVRSKWRRGSSRGSPTSSWHSSRIGSPTHSGYLLWWCLASSSFEAWGESSGLRIQKVQTAQVVHTWTSCFSTTKEGGSRGEGRSTCCRSQRAASSEYCSWICWRRALCRWRICVRIATRVPAWCSGQRLTRGLSSSLV